MKIESFFRESHKRKIEKIQIVEEKNLSTDIFVLNGTLMDYDFYESTDYRIKALYAGKTIKLITEYLDMSIIDTLIEKAENTESSFEDIYLNDTSLNNTENDDCDVSIDNINEIKNLENLKKQYKEITDSKYYYSISYQKTRIVNDNGVDISTSSKRHSFYVSVVASSNDDKVTFSDNVLSVKDDIDIERLSKKVMESALLMLNKRKIDTGKYDIILTNNVSTKILSKIVSMADAHSVRKKTSYLGNKLGEKVFGDNFTIIEDPLDKESVGYRTFDDEGSFTYKKEIFTNGTLNTFLYDNKEALLSKRTSTSNYYGGIGVRNCYLKPGSASYDSLVKHLNNGLIITDFMGASGSSMNILTGNISIQVFGFIVEKGKITGSFIPSVLTSDFKELLCNIKEIGDDLVARNLSFSSPSLLIKDINIASK